MATAGNGLTGGPSTSLPPAPAYVAAAALLRSAPSSQTVMQPLDLPARAARVAVVPRSSSHEAWAIGYSSAVKPGWDWSSPLGQIVFLHYTDDTGWTLAGPPTLNGSPTNRHLFALAMLPSGEGWAVGESGTMAHHAVGSAGWTITPSVTAATLESVSLTDNGGTAGFAVGEPDPATGGMTILHLSGGSWQAMTPPTLASANPPDLSAVAAVSADEAWAVSGESAQALTAAVTTQALYVLHYTKGSWSQPTTGQNMFDHPPAKSQGGNSTVEYAVGGAVAATSGGAWVFGRIQPNQSSTLLGDQLTGDRSRPFAIWFPSDGSAVTTYCPAVESVDSSGAPNPDRICVNNFPLAAFGIDTAAIPPEAASAGGPPEVFAGGLGLFHFNPGVNDADSRWERAPDAIGYLGSIALDSASEGWMAGTGSNAAGGGPFSQTLAIGHWTRNPNVPAMAPWPDPARNVVEGVALAPDGSGAVLAVGQNEARLHKTSGHDWVLQAFGGGDLHAVAWPATGSAWAVGNGETLDHWDGHGWSHAVGPRSSLDAPPDDLFSVAFANASTGWAVGARGTILDYSGGRWRRDGVPNHTTPLYTVAAVPGGAVAAGAGGTVLVDRGGSWSEDQGASAVLTAAGATGLDFYASATLPDGTMALGGGRGVILLRSPGGGWRLLSDSAGSVDGTVVALGLSGSGANPEVVVSVDPNGGVKYVSGALATTQGWLYLFDGTAWHDVELDHQVTMWPSTDTAAPHDPVLAMAIEPGAVRGWAVGGFPADTVENANNAYQSSTGTGSLYRLDLGGDPSPPSSTVSIPPPPKRGFTFAFLGDSACSNGLCGAADGSGDMADVMLQQAQQEIAMAHPDLTVFGGNMRLTGLPEELATVKRLADNWGTPFFATLGNQDVVSSLGSVPGINAPANTPASGTSGPGYYLREFGGEPGPWGPGAPASTSFRDADPYQLSQVTGNEARSHYAFDYAPVGLPPQARFVFVNDSDGSLNDTGGNPGGTSPQTTQSTWLTSVLSAGNLPTIVFMGLPLIDPRTNTSPLNATDQATFTGDVATARPVPSALFSSSIAGNLTYNVPAGVGASVPGYISGGAGSPLAGSKNPLHGYYHSWMLVTVDPDVRNALGQASVTPLPMPLLQWVALSIFGPGGSSEKTFAAGSLLHAHGLGRTPDAGLANLNGPSPDASQTRAEYLDMPNTWAGAPNCQVGEQDNCTAPYGMQPYYRFVSENPSVADFVQDCPRLDQGVGPCLNPDGTPIEDHQNGVLCTFQPGTAWIDIIAGVREARQLITVGPGSGQCNHNPPTFPVEKNDVVVADINPHLPAVPLAPQPIPLPVIKPAHHHVFFHNAVQNPTVAALAPPPVPVLAGAPPLTAAGTAAKKEEEREKAFEHSRENSGGHTHQAVAYMPADSRWDPRPVAAAGAGLFGMFIVAAAWAAARRRPNAAIDIGRWE